MILVTGATGNVGKHLVRLLVERGAPTRVFVRNEQKLGDLRDKVEVVIGDLDQPETLIPAVSGVESVYIIAASVQQVGSIVDAAKRAGVRHLVKQSTIEANRSLGPGKWHRVEEKLIEASGLHWTFLRPTMMMVNTIRWWAASIKAQGAVYFPAGDGKVSPVDERDVALVASHVLTEPRHDGQIYELTGPEVLTIKEMVQVLAQCLGKPIRYTQIPALVGALWMLRYGLPFYVVRGLMETLGALRRHEYAYVSDAVVQVAGHRARPFEAWVGDHLADFQ